MNLRIIEQFSHFDGPDKIFMEILTPSQLSSSHPSPTPSVPPGFSPIPVNPPTVSHFVSQQSSTFESNSLHSQTSEFTTSSLLPFESMLVANPALVNTHPMQTRSKSGIHNPRLHPSLFLVHSEPKTVKRALEKF